ncbi:MAG: hypothetical protein AAGC45_10180 [Bacteroidota bacterium]
MRKICFVLLLPLLFAFQCEEDDLSGFETSYFIQNETNTSLFFFGFENRLIEIDAQTAVLFRSDLNSETLPIRPSETIEFSTIQLFKNVDSDFILSYEQAPIDDNLWLFEEPSENRFEYTLVVTDELID